MHLEKDPWNLIITGVGGQGNVLASQLLGQVLVDKGYLVTIGETYGASQRGGSVMSHLRVSLRDQFSPLIPEGQCDLVIGLEPVEALRVLGLYGHPGVLCLINTRPIYPIDVISGEGTYPEVSVVLEAVRRLSRRAWSLNATQIALEIGDPIFSNMAMLGALSALGLLPVDRNGFQSVIEAQFPSDRWENNAIAFDRGRKAVTRAVTSPPSGEGADER